MANPDATPADPQGPGGPDGPPADPQGTDGPPADPEPAGAYPEVPPGRRSLRAAWWSLLCIPVAYVLAYLVGSGILDRFGYSVDDEASRPTLGASIAAGVPATLVMIGPGVLALWFGLRARREGEPRGLAPALVGAIISGYQVLTGVIGIIQMAS